MAISNELMLAILSMDSYNRGYGAGIGDGVNVDGQGNDIDGLGGIGFSIGTANVTAEDVSTDAQAAGFYAVAYEWNGETVISYRGTDDYVLDPLNGWTLAAGDTYAPQGELAAAFYDSVSQGQLYGSNVTFTGHSLGGGLAGFVPAPGATVH